MNETNPLVGHSPQNLYRNKPPQNGISLLARKNQSIIGLCTLSALLGLITLFIRSQHYNPQYVLGASDTAKCQNHDSFQQSAKKIVPAAFSKLDYTNRQSAEYLTSRLGIFGFAYFPLKNDELSYERWEFNKSNPGGKLALQEPEVITTRDPVEAVL